MFLLYSIVKFGLGQHWRGYALSVDMDLGRYLPQLQVVLMGGPKMVTGHIWHSPTIEESLGSSLFQPVAEMLQLLKKTRLLFIGNLSQF